MSEQNVLNPNVGDDLNPDYGYSEGLPQMMSSFQAKSGAVTTRQLLARGRVYDLQWQSRPIGTADALRQWEAQYRADFFTYKDQERGRHFSGRFAAPPQISPAGFNKWNIQAQFVEIPGLPMFAWPGAWGVDSIFIGVLDGFGNQLVKITGTGVSNNFNNPAFKPNPGGTNGIDIAVANDTAEWEYFGYGFRLWTIKEAADGIMEVSLDGTVIAAAVDLYNAGTVTGILAGTFVNVRLGLHRVKLRNTGTKNAAASAFNMYADTIEVMQ